MRLVPPKGDRAEAVTFFGRRPPDVCAPERLELPGTPKARREMSNGNGHAQNGADGKNGSKAQNDVERQSADVRLPNSRRVYAEGGTTEGVRVPFREVSLQPTRLPDGRVEENEPVRVYDTSGPWGDPEVRSEERSC